jgi:hypothetical protein
MYRFRRFNILPVVFLLSVASVSYAQGLPASNSFDRFMWTATGGANQTVGFGTTGQVLASPGIPNISTDGGLPRVSVSGSLPNPSGRLVPVTAVGRIPAAEVGKAVGRALGKIVVPLTVGVALYDLAKELGFTLSNSSGAVGVTKTDSNVCTTAPCTEWFDGNPYDSGQWHRSVSAACSSRAAYITSNDANFNAAVVNLTSYNCSIRMTWKTDGGLMGTDPFNPYSRSAEPAVATPVPSTQQEFLDAVATKSGWPSSSNVAKVLVQAGDLAPATKIQTEPLTVTGPATSTGTTTTTVNTTNNLSKTSVLNYNHSYTGSSVATTAVTSAITTDTSTGTVTSNEVTTTESAPKPDAKEIEVCGLPNTPACLIDETGTPKDKSVTFDESKTDLEKVRTDTAAEIEKAATISAPSWSFSFQLPTGCAPYVTGLRGFIMNVCPYQSTIHDLLSMIWAAATAFACIGMVGRTIREA